MVTKSNRDVVNANVMEATAISRLYRRMTRPARRRTTEMRSKTGTAATIFATSAIITLRAPHGQQGHPTMPRKI